MKTDRIIFKVTYGYGSTDFVLVSNSADVEKAIYAKVEKIPVTLGGKMISGQEIKSIEPDVHSYTGWHRSYEAVNGDDFAQIERDVPKVTYDVLDACSKRVSEFLNSGRPELIGKEALTTVKLLKLAGVEK